MKPFDSIVQELQPMILTWEKKLLALPDAVITGRRNKQGRSIKEIVGHMVDSATNNTHRIIHLQYQESPLVYPDYANLGNNQKWIAIQNYQHEDWHELVQLWKYCNLHICHVMEQVDAARFDSHWITALEQKVTLKTMITDFPRHFKLHLGEIQVLMDQA